MKRKCTLTFVVIYLFTFLFIYLFFSFICSFIFYLLIYFFHLFVLSLICFCFFHLFVPSFFIYLFILLVYRLLKFQKMELCCGDGVKISAIRNIDLSIFFREKAVINKNKNCFRKILHSCNKMGKSYHLYCEFF